MLKPAITFEIVEVEPRENRTPRKMETPLNASDLEPGMYGKATVNAKARMKKRTILKVGTAQSA